MKGRTYERALWFGVIGAPIAWAVDLLTSFAIEKSYCMAHGSGLVAFGGVSLWLAVIGAVTFAVGIAAGMTAWQMRRRFRVHGPDSTPVEDRRRFMANAGVAISGLFLFAILLRASAPLFVSAASCGPTG